MVSQYEIIYMKLDCWCTVHKILFLLYILPEVVRKDLNISMKTIKISKFTYQSIEILYTIGVWSKEGTSLRRKKLNSMLFLLFGIGHVVMMGMGSIMSTDRSDQTFMAAATISASALCLRVIIMYMRSTDTSELPELICIHQAENTAEFNEIKTKLNILERFSMCLIGAVYFTGILLSGIPLLSKENILPMNIWLPFNWKENKYLYWTAYMFNVVGLFYLATLFYCTVFIWNLMLNGGIMYQVLGSFFKTLGFPRKKLADNIESLEGTILTPKILFESIRKHQHVQCCILQLKSCFASLFVVQIATSGLCICLAVYSLTSALRSKIIFECIIYTLFLTHGIFDIFIIMYFGNEIESISGGLSYNLYESNWRNQMGSIKKIMMIHMEVLKHPDALVVGKIYPLNLNTFTSIMKGAYSIFNLLNNI